MRKLQWRAEKGETGGGRGGGGGAHISLIVTAVWDQSADLTLMQHLQ